MGYSMPNSLLLKNSSGIIKPHSLGVRRFILIENRWKEEKRKKEDREKKESKNESKKERKKEKDR